MKSLNTSLLQVFFSITIIVSTWFFQQHVHAAVVLQEYQYSTYLILNSSLENTTSASSCGTNSSYPCYSIQQQIQAIDEQLPSLPINFKYAIQLTINVMSDIPTEMCNFKFTNPNSAKFATFVFIWLGSKPDTSKVLLDCQGSEFFSFSNAPASLNITNQFDSFDVKNTIFKEQMIISSMNHCNLSGSAIYKMNEKQTTMIYDSNFYNCYWFISNVNDAISFRECKITNSSMVVDVISKSLSISESSIENVDLILKFSTMTFLSTTFNDNLAIFTQFQSLLLHECNFFTTKQTLISFGDSMTIRRTLFEKSNLDFKIVSVRSVIIGNSTFSGNYQTNLSNKALIQLTGSYSLTIANSTFINNRDLLLMSIYQASLVNFQNSIFQQNTGGGAVQIEHMVGYFKLSSVTFSNCTFNGNKGQNGGAILIGMTFGNLTISNCQFTKNSANYGGALYLQQEKVAISNCQFTGNSATQNGGAIYVKDTTFLSLQSSTLQNNMANRGGALYLSSLTSNYMMNSACSNNIASYSGGCLFAQSTTHPTLLQSVSTSLSGLNSAISYGHNIATPIDGTQFQFSVKYQEGQAATEMPTSLSLYPGQPVDITVKIKDKNNQAIKSIEFPMGVSVGSNMTVTVDSLSTDYLTLHGLYLSVYSSIDFLSNTTLNLTLSSDTFFSIPVQIVPCNQDYSLQPVSSNGNAMICTKNPPGFPYSVVLPVVLIGGVLLFIVGIAFGIAVLYGVYIIVKKLKKLEKKEKAEMKLEKTLIDKKFIFTGSTTTPPAHAQSSKSVASTRQSLHDQEKYIIPIENLDIVKKIGEGSNGMVYLANWNGTEVAVKSLKLDFSELQGESEEFEREASLLSSLRHPNIVNFYGVSMTDTGKFMVVEYLPRGSLDKLIYQCKVGKEKLALSKKLSILLGISNGMAYLHSLKPNMIVHRDLKPGNILLDNNLTPKVCDFGLSKVIGTMNGTMTTNIGTLFYMAPEILSGGVQEGMNAAIDVYAFGIILWELYFEQVPFMETNSSKLSRFKAQDLTGSPKLQESHIPFQVPTMVMNGIRPEIPFSNREEEQVWIKEFILPNETQQEQSLEKLVRVTEAYMDLTRACWSLRASERPDFVTISQKIQQMISILN
ncbi:hypothetical protein C9374_001479 [Naegleria lovaniensis]|uniref:Protein kinase domain-containing protein n=1 Tax=Naegleria lovaniensis TaxID=51637 RepID=A0AA88KR96_NAELO|nr:uncharacterized protein C9374_001479 [Naegleria lovaniensis]KAG2387147.1 hypothetical protein C9374_001479 [Naegleria lovaniensis]